MSSPHLFLLLKMLQHQCLHCLKLDLHRVSVMVTQHLIRGTALAIKCMH